jgi:hypothetical protein
MANEQENAEKTNESMMDEGNVGEVSQPAHDPMAQKQLELENQYKNICAQEIMLLDQSEKIQQQLEQAKKQRQALAVQVETLRSIAA